MLRRYPRDANQVLPCSLRQFDEPFADNHALRQLWVPCPSIQESVSGLSAVTAQNLRQH
jgi:hypothetical protein